MTKFQKIALPILGMILMFILGMIVQREIIDKTIDQKWEFIKADYKYTIPINREHGTVVVMGKDIIEKYRTLK